MFLTLVSIRLTSTGLHMRYQNLRENTHDFFSGVELQDWNGIGYKGGYDTAEFTSDISGTPSRCIAVQRYLNPAYRRLQAPRHRHGLRGRQPGRGLRRPGKDAGAGGLRALRGLRRTPVMPRLGLGIHEFVRGRAWRMGLHHDQQAQRDAYVGVTSSCPASCSTGPARFRIHEASRLESWSSRAARPSRGIRAKSHQGWSRAWKIRLIIKENPEWTISTTSPGLGNSWMPRPSLGMTV